jgi:hypothetical protein
MRVNETPSRAALRAPTDLRLIAASAGDRRSSCENGDTP